MTARVAASALEKTKPNTHCCDCGRSAREDGNRTWTVQGFNCRCTACSRREGILD